jgi:epsilon-lactone hydrolase
VADPFDGISLLAAEPPDVTYAEATTAGLPTIWANPVGCDAKRVLAYIHGGGFIGSKESHRKFAAHLAKSACCRALIPDYRLAPEHTFPAQLEDALAVYDWPLTPGYRPSEIVFAGESAGGNIATTTALALERDGRPLPAAIVAFSPRYDIEGEIRSSPTPQPTHSFLAR